MQQTPNGFMDTDKDLKGISPVMLHELDIPGTTPEEIEADDATDEADPAGMIIGENQQPAIPLSSGPYSCHSAMRTLSQLM